MLSLSKHRNDPRPKIPSTRSGRTEEDKKTAYFMRFEFREETSEPLPTSRSPHFPCAYQPDALLKTAN
jgi:hypothetical protein